MNRQTRLGNVRLVAANDFTISSTISDSATVKSAGNVGLYPGVTRYFWYTATNSSSLPITVTSMKIPTNGVTAPAGCDASNLDLTHTTFTGSLSVPAKVGAVNGSASVEVGAISFMDEPHNDQQGCKSKTFNFSYTGSAQYTEVYNTTTAVTSSHNPSTVGQSVTYTATVSGLQGTNPDPVPSSPTGTVTFTDNTTTICSAVAVLSATTTTSTATCTPPTYAVAGTHPITAVFTHGTDNNFANSPTSPTLSQVVNSTLPGTSTVLASTPNPSIFGTSVALTATVTKASGSGTPTGTVSFYSGASTLLGNGTLNVSDVATFSTSALPAGTTSLYAVYNGDTHFAGSTSPNISQQVIALPVGCSGSYNLIVGNPASPTVNGTNGNDFIYAVGANFTVNGAQGNDCIQVGDTSNTISEGNGNSTIVAGNGKNTISAGNGNNTITLGTGSGSTVTLGNGNDTVRITSPGGHATITSGNGVNTIFLGGGTNNTFKGGKSGNTCHLASLPPSSLSDTLTNCSAVSP